MNPDSSHFRVQVKLKGRNRSTGTVAMIDSGATALFLDHLFVKKHNIPSRPFANPLIYTILMEALTKQEESPTSPVSS